MRTDPLKKKARMVVWVDPMGFVEGRGFRVSIVIEGEGGHRPTGNWPYKPGPGQQMPWFWGPTIEDAEAACDDYNARMGISRAAAWEIVMNSIAQGIKESRARRATNIRKAVR